MEEVVNKVKELLFDKLDYIHYNIGGFDNTVEACVEMIIKLHELNLLRL